MKSNIAGGRVNSGLQRGLEESYYRMNLYQTFGTDENGRKQNGQQIYRPSVSLRMWYQDENSGHAEILEA